MRDVKRLLHFIFVFESHLKMLVFRVGLLRHGLEHLFIGLRSLKFQSPVLGFWVLGFLRGIPKMLEILREIGKHNITM